MYTYSEKLQVCAIRYRMLIGKETHVTHMIKNIYTGGPIASYSTDAEGTINDLNKDDKEEFLKKEKEIFGYNITN